MKVNAALAQNSRPHTTAFSISNWPRYKVLLCGRNPVWTAMDESPKASFMLERWVGPSCSWVLLKLFSRLRCDGPFGACILSKPTVEAQVKSVDLGKPLLHGEQRQCNPEPTPSLSNPLNKKYCTSLWLRARERERERVQHCNFCLRYRLHVKRWESRSQPLNPTAEQPEQSCHTSRLPLCQLPYPGDSTNNLQRQIRYDHERDWESYATPPSLQQIIIIIQYSGSIHSCSSSVPAGWLPAHSYLQVH